MNAASGKEDGRRREAFFKLVNPHLDWLDQFTRHLVRYSEAIGELGRDELTPEEVVDAALINAYRQFLKNLSIGEVRSWLTRVAVDQLDSEINRLLSERQRAPIHIEDDVPETPPEEQVVQLGDESLYFHQPDEDLKLEDVISDPDTVTPEEALEATETRECVADALRSVPDEWRRILLLHYTEGQASAKIAGSVGKPESEVRRILSYSTRYVRQRLIESGCAPTNRRRAA
jgi:RNA polymerase sigma factor (sigma-70 family)